MAFKTIGGLWKSEKGFLSGKDREDIVIPAGTKFFVFENKNVEGNKPTHRLAIVTDEAETQYARPANDPSGSQPWEEF